MLRSQVGSPRTCQIRSSAECFRLCGTMERGSRLSCDASTWRNVVSETVRTDDMKGISFHERQAESEDKPQPLTVTQQNASAFAFTPFDDLYQGLGGWLSTVLLNPACCTDSTSLVFPVGTGCLVLYSLSLKKKKTSHPSGTISPHRDRPAFH